MSERLNEAVNLIKSGDKDSAAVLLAELVKSEPNNELAWLWLGICLKDVDKVHYCFQKVVEINPNNLKARELLNSLTDLKLEIDDYKREIEAFRQMRRNQGNIGRE